MTLLVPIQGSPMSKSTFIVTRVQEAFVDLDEEDLVDEDPHAVASEVARDAGEWETVHTEVSRA